MNRFSFGSAQSERETERRRRGSTCRTAAAGSPGLHHLFQASFAADSRRLGRVGVDEQREPSCLKPASSALLGGQMGRRRRGGDQGRGESRRLGRRRGGDWGSGFHPRAQGRRREPARVSAPDQLVPARSRSHSGLVRFVPSRPESAPKPGGSAGIVAPRFNPGLDLKVHSVKTRRCFTPPGFRRKPPNPPGFKQSSPHPWMASRKDTERENIRQSRASSLSMTAAVAATRWRRRRAAGAQPTGGEGLL
jgi:hypothetical protein